MGWVDMTGIEDRYGYYRRCRVLRRNGEQCKAPAMKGTHICYKHLEGAEMEERWKRQRQELLARPGLGFGDLRSIQRTIRAAAQAMIDGSIDFKVAGRVLLDLQTASRLLRKQTLPRMNAEQRGSEQNKEFTTELRKSDEKQTIVSRREFKCSARQGHPRLRAEVRRPNSSFCKMHSENKRSRGQLCHIFIRQGEVKGVGQTVFQDWDFERTCFKRPGWRTQSNREIKAQLMTKG